MQYTRGNQNGKDLIVSQNNKPLLALTMGDAAGSGSEIVTKTLADPEILQICRAVVVGDAATMHNALKITGMPGEVRAIDDISQAEFSDDTIEVLDLNNIDLDKLVHGRIDPMAGAAAYDCIKLAAELALDGKVDAMVTSAINKDSLNKAGYHYDGHTGLLAELCDAPDATMMLVAGPLRVAHVCTHLSLREALDRIQPDRILKVIRLTHEAVRDLGIEQPHIAVAGLNPHAGEDGLFGDEEIRAIQPAIEEACREGFHVTGPYPGDTVFLRNQMGHFDAAIAMYHDQGHVAVKMVGLFLGVNVTLGLPIIRTSVDHGTNFGKAGKGTADPRSMNEAVKLAAIMARTRAERMAEAK